MKISSAARRQLAILAVLAGVLILALVRSGRNVPAPAARAVSTGVRAGDAEESASRGRGRGDAKKANADDVPVITRQDLDSVGSATGTSARNIFDFPSPTPPPTPTPAPPDIPFKFIGTFGPKDQPIAVLVAGDKIVNARAGDTVFERFVIKKVGYESIDVGFIGRWTEVRRLPIAP